MKEVICSFVFIILLNNICLADAIKQPTPPKPPTEPINPNVPGSPEASTFQKFPRLPVFPSFPVLPNENTQNNERVREIEKYELIITEAFPGGDTQKNVANTINYSEYILYSNNTISLKLNFNNNLQYIYHLKNKRSKMEISPGVYREIYDTVIQVEKEFLLEQYASELFYNEISVVSLNIFGNNKIIVTMNFIKK
jgi:hypothetical protein